MLATRDTSHSLIGPCGPLEQSPCGGNSRQPAMALWSCVLDCGEKAEYPGVNTPLPAQNFGAMHNRSVRKRIRRCHGEMICTCWLVHGIAHRLSTRMWLSVCFGINTGIRDLPACSAILKRKHAIFSGYQRHEPAMALTQVYGTSSVQKK